MAHARAHFGRTGELWVGVCEMAMEVCVYVCGCVCCPADDATTTTTTRRVDETMRVNLLALLRLCVRGTLARYKYLYFFILGATPMCRIECVLVACNSNMFMGFLWAPHLSACLCLCSVCIYTCFNFDAHPLLCLLSIPVDAVIRRAAAIATRRHRIQ